MASSDKKILVVFGATGKQGGSVIQSILDDKEAASTFSLRAITRNPKKPNAKALAEKGVECVSVRIIFLFPSFPPAPLLSLQLKWRYFLG